VHYSRRRQAATLVEVLGALALSGSLLVAVIHSGNQIRRSMYGTHIRESAQHAIQLHMEDWWLNPESMPRFGEGTVGNTSTLKWKAVRRPHDLWDKVNLEMVTYTFLDTRLENANESRPIATITVYLEEETIDEP